MTKWFSGSEMEKIKRTKVWRRDVHENRKKDLWNKFADKGGGNAKKLPKFRNYKEYLFIKCTLFIH